MPTDDRAAASPHPIRPSRVWYWVGVAALVASVVWLVLGLLRGFGSFARDVEDLVSEQQRRGGQYLSGRMAGGELPADRQRVSKKRSGRGAPQRLGRLFPRASRPRVG